MKAETRALWRSVLRRTRRTPDWVGYWLYQQRRREGVGPSAQAKTFQVSLKKLISLSLCLTPRLERFAEDVGAIANHCGILPTVLAGFLREEWALAQGQVTGQNPSGWLRAASLPPEEPPNPAADADHAKP